MSVTDEAAWAALPETGFLRDYVTYCSGRTDAPTAYHILAGLTLLSQLTTMTVRFGARKVRPNLFTLMIGDSTRSRKGVSIDLCKEILKAVKPYAVQEEPGSVQALFESTKLSRHGVLVYEEFGAFLSKSEQGPMMAMKTAFNKLYDGDPLGNARAADVRARGKAGVGTEDHCISVMAGSAPNYLERHTELVDWKDGFFARFMCITGDRQRLLDFPKDDPAARYALIEYFKKMYEAFQIKVDIKKDKPVTDEPTEADEIEAKHKQEKLRVQSSFDRDMANHFQDLTPEAQALFIEWQAETERRAGSARFTASIARAPMMCMKIALLMAFQNQWWKISQKKDWSVGLAEIEVAIQLTELHIKSIFDMGRFISEDEWNRKRLTVLNVIHPITPVSSANIIAMSRLSKRDVEQILASLEHENAIEKAPCPEDEKKGKGAYLAWYISNTISSESYTPPQIENPERFMTAERSQPFGIHSAHINKPQSGTSPSKPTSEAENSSAGSKSAATVTAAGATAVSALPSAAKSHSYSIEIDDVYVPD